MNRISDADQLALVESAALDACMSVDDILADYARIATAPGRLTIGEYLRNDLHRRGRFTEDERLEFLSSRLHWPIVTRCCDMSWYGAVDDKWLCQSLLAASGLPVPETVAVVDRTQRLYIGTRTLRSASDLADFLVSRQGRPFFAKPVRGIGGQGAILCEEDESRSVRVRGHGTYTAEALFEALGSTPYLLQEVLKNHPKLQVMAPHLATVRLLVFVYDDMVTLAFAVLKVPAPENIIDSPLAPGNFVCSISDPDGKIISMVGKTQIGRLVHDVHPFTGAATLGLELPYWSAIREIAAKAARIFAPLRYQSMDVAITALGPVLVEVNAGGSLGMIQRATRRGFLQPHVRHFLQVCGIDLQKIGAGLEKTPRLSDG